MKVWLTIYVVYTPVEMTRKYGGKIYNICTAFEVIQKYGVTVCMVYTAVELIGSMALKCIRYTLMLK